MLCHLHSPRHIVNRHTLFLFSPLLPTPILPHFLLALPIDMPRYYGGGKGAVRVDPHSLSKSELERLSSF
ncbi:hypothetical protein EON65_55425 [archaeon]|nr:MAG: hypothetical protein EON65_55425 [archaeon]